MILMPWQLKKYRRDIKTVGHIPRKISAICICLIFIRGGSIVCLVDGSRRYLYDLPQGGLKIPCILKFVASNSNEADKTRQQLESTFMHASNFMCADTVTFSSEVVAKSMVDGQLQSEAQSSSTPIKGDFSIDSPCVYILQLV